MPVERPEGIVVVLCTGKGEVLMRIDPATGEPIDSTPVDGHKICDWSVLALAGDVPGATPLPDRTVLARPATPAIPPLVLAIGQATGLPPSTGPPSIV